MSQAVIIDAVRTPIGRASSEKGYYRNEIGRASCRERV